MAESNDNNNVEPDKISEAEVGPTVEASAGESAPNNKRKLGAALPDWLADKNESDDDEPDRKRRKLNEDEPKKPDDDEDTFGPRPALANMFQPEEESEDTEENKRIRREKEQKQWEMLRSNTTGSIQTGPSKREEWMTKLPDTKKVSLDFDLMQKSVTSFSRKGVDDRGDVSGWTSTPGEEPAAAPQLSALELAKQMVAERVAADKERQNREAIEKHSSVNRQKSLMEQHYEMKMQKNEKKDKKDKDKDKKEKKGKDKDKKHRDKDKKHKDKKDKKGKKDKKDKKEKKKDEKEYVPYFDRERDLKVGIIDSKRTSKLLSENDALLSRFGSSRSSKFL